MCVFTSFRSVQTMLAGPKSSYTYENASCISRW